MFGESTDDDNLETKTCFILALLLLSYSLFQMHKLNSDIVIERVHKIDQCNFVAIHKAGSAGTWDNDRQICTIRVRFTSSVGSSADSFEQDIPVDQYPPPSI